MTEFSSPEFDQQCPTCHGHNCLPDDEHDGKMKPCPDARHWPHAPEGMDDLYRELVR